MHIPAGAGQVNLIFSGSAAPNGAQVTWGFECIDAGDPAAAAADIIARWIAGPHSLMVNTIQLASALVKFGPNDNGPSALVASGASGGSGVGVSEVPNTSMLVQKITSQGGRKGRGRMFIPGVPESTFTGNGSQSGASTAVWQAQVDELLAGLNTDGWPMLLLHADPFTVATQVTQLRVSSIAATQRRRLRR